MIIYDVGDHHAAVTQLERGFYLLHDDTTSSAPSQRGRNRATDTLDLGLYKVEREPPEDYTNQMNTICACSSSLP